MNVMQAAHKAAKAFFASVTETGLSYRAVLKIKLRVMHREAKALSNIWRALGILKRAKFDCFGSGQSVVVRDPVQCRRGKKTWTEYNEVRINVESGLEKVYKFLQERS